MTTTDVYYDPYDPAIDADPYPTFKRLRDEAPIYYNDRHGFWALSRYEDVIAALKDTARLSSTKGDIIEVIKADPVMPPAVFINEDPPLHTIHRALVSRAFTPSKMRKIEQQVRNFTAACLDPLVGTDRFDFVTELGAILPMRTICMLVGIPDADQPAVRDYATGNLRSQRGAPMAVDPDKYFDPSFFAEYVDWREKNPSNDLITELLGVEFEDENGIVRNLTKPEILTFLTVVAGAGVDTTGRMFGWMAKVLAEHPDQRREIVEDRSLIPNAIEELLRFESSAPNAARYVSEDVEFHGTTVPAGSVLTCILLAANRDERQFDNPDVFDIHRKIGQHSVFGHGIHFCLGASLARLELRVALEEMLNRFPEWDVDLSAARRSQSPVVRGWDRMPVILS
ncbi:cytochrome [Parafrankia soli]|uniref:Cytochrome n=1 Tax=Parafrankia soli TaxID=2599596 RepID=A0A1S1R748_9ACTN|nr:cytochrome P450 [Parafrankia soli]OHV42798.1 cytochrome [Parafrankia soli]